MRLPEYNVSKISVGGDAAGLIIVGTVVAGGLNAIPALWPFLLGSAVVGGTAARMLWWKDR